MTSSDNEFIKFLEKTNHYSKLIGTFKFTLFSLFVALLYSIIAFAITNYITLKCLNKNNCETYQSKIWFIIFAVISTYSLIATFLSVKDTFSFAIRRVKFLGL